MEDPIYRLYRHEYYGYHPTCWRRFPGGWGCPSPEAPNPAESFRVLPRQAPPAADTVDGAAEGEQGPNGAAPGTTTVPGTPDPNALPPLPGGDRSPFELDPKANQPEGQRGPASGDRRSPPASDRPSGEARSVAPANELLAPPLQPTNVPSPGPGASTEPSGEEPVLSLPDPSAPANAANSGASAQPTPGFSGGNDPGGRGSAGFPIAAPRRTSLLSNLFSGRSLRRR
ncbi:MAG: hypothetical protein NVSMB9_18820 [Isosphaeraceae bacterium]